MDSKLPYLDQSKLRMVYVGYISRTLKRSSVEFPGKVTSRSKNESKRVDIKESEKVSVPGAHPQEASCLLATFLSSAQHLVFQGPSRKLFHGAFGTVNGIYRILRAVWEAPFPLLVTGDPRKAKLQRSSLASSLVVIVRGDNRWV